MFERILVPVDDNAVSRRALLKAAELAEQTGAKLIVTHVVEPAPTYTMQVAQNLPAGEFDRSRREYAEALLASMREAVPPSVQAEYLVRFADRSVWREIVHATEALAADLVVIGTHGHDGLARAVLGSVAERVARHAGAPVMLVR